MEPFLGEISMMGFNFPPRGWAKCDGQLMSIVQNTALFSLLGTTFGGDGKVTFALPDLRARAPMGQGQGSGLSDRTAGELGGETAVGLVGTEVPLAHAHTLSGLNNRTGQNVPGPQVGLNRSVNGNAYASNVTDNQVPLDPSTVGPSSPGAGTGPHNNVQPSLVVSFCIAWQGIYPRRQ